MVILANFSTLKIRRFSFNRNIGSENNSYPDGYAMGFICYYVRGWLFIARTYITWFVIDNSGKFLCIWSFKTNSIGDPYRGTKRITRKITRQINGKYVDAEIISVVKVRRG